MLFTAKPHDTLFLRVPMRIVINGSSGSGKSTLAREVSRVQHLPYIELDALNHGPNWTPASAEELRRKVLSSIGDHDG